MSQEMQVVSQNIEPVQAMGPEQQTLFDLEELTVRSANDLESLKTKIKEAKELITDTLMQNEDYKIAKATADSARKGFVDVKKKTFNSAQVAALVQTLHDLQLDQKEQIGAISDYAREYARMSGADTIVRENMVFDIVTMVKVIAHRSKGKK